MTHSVNIPSHCSPHSASLEDILQDGRPKDLEGSFPLRSLFEVDFPGGGGGGRGRAAKR